MNYIKAIPYIIALALIAGVLRFAYTSGYNASERKWNDKYTVDLGKANDNLVKTKRELQEAQTKQAEIEADLLQKQKEHLDSANNTIADLRAGNVRLRESLTIKQCASVSVTTSSTSSNHAASTGGLSEEDVRFLISEASRADQCAEQLTAAQKVIIQDRLQCNGSNP